MIKFAFVFIICCCFASPAFSDSRVLVLKPNAVLLLPLNANGIVKISSNVEHTNLTHLVLHVNALKPVCVGNFLRPCPSNSAFKGTDVGWEQIVSRSAKAGRLTWDLHSDTTQTVFIALRAYKKAALIGACTRNTRLPFFNPNLVLDLSHDTYEGVSFNFSTVFKSDEKSMLKCSDGALKEAIIYDLYAVPWNQRYLQPYPSFNTSSLRHLPSVLNDSSSADVFNKGILLTSLRMSSPYSLPDLRISKRIGLDVVITVVARLDIEDSEAAFYVSRLLWGCTRDPRICELLHSLILKILVGVFACFGLLFSHLGRRFHRLNTFFSGYILGFLLSYILLGRFTKLDWEANLAISLSICAMGFAALTCGIFWRSKPNCRSSYLPLYVDTSFLLVASLFFTSIGNQSLWKEEAVFVGTFYGLVAFLSVLIFPWVTEMISVNLCTALLGNFIFVAGASAIFLPGCVFPFILWDAVGRVAEPGSHAALSIFVNSVVDFAVFSAWPLLSLLVAIFNRCCTPPLTPQPDPVLPVAPTESWPPLPPDAFVSERAPLLNVRRDSVAIPATAPPPPPYFHPGEDPPAYHP